MIRRKAGRLGVLLARATLSTPAAGEALPLLQRAGLSSCSASMKDRLLGPAQPPSGTAPSSALVRLGRGAWASFAQRARSRWPAGRGVHAAAEPLPLQDAYAAGLPVQSVSSSSLPQFSQLAPPLPPPLRPQQQQQPQVLPWTPPGSPGQQAPAAAAAAPPSALMALAGRTLWVEGTVQKVHFRHPNTAYTVLKVQVTATPELEAAAAAAGAGALFAPKPRGRSRSSKAAAAAPADAAAPAAPHRARKVTIGVVGNLPQVQVGQCLRFAGGWGEHKQYGWQFRASDLQVSGRAAQWAAGEIERAGRASRQRPWLSFSTELCSRAHTVVCAPQQYGLQAG